MPNYNKYPTTWHSSACLKTIEKALDTKAKYLPLEYPVDTIYTEIATDSRMVTEGAIFIAVTGSKQDGVLYIPAALANGASLIVSEKQLDPALEKILEQYSAAYLQVANSRTAAGKVAEAFYDYPSRKLTVVGVTGTNGKTTTATLLYDFFTALGYTCGLIGTIENRIDKEREKAQLTTPGPVALQQLFHRMVAAGCRYVFMEVSSHALDQQRVEGVRYSAAIFTNLTRDHLDYHKDMKEYQKAKKKLFDQLDEKAFAIVNGDDKHADFMLQNCKARKYRYALQSPADFSAHIVEKSFEGTEIMIGNQTLCVQLIGLFNIYNIIAVYAAARLLLPNHSEEDLLIEFSKLKHIAGRFEVLRSPLCTAVVDYAHTPDAISKILETTKEIVGKSGRIITVVGAGGDRDKGKRPLMTKEALKISDFVVLTSDNPRTEDPEAILDDMMVGLSDSDRTRLLAISNRREAIRTAINLATPCDVVVVAGKGHEDYQEINGVRHHFDDREEIDTYFKLKKNS